MNAAAKASVRLFFAIFLVIAMAGSAYAACSITIASPNGGEVWRGTKTISWNASSCGNDFDIYHNLNGAGFPSLDTGNIADNYGDSSDPREYSWSTSTVADGTDYKIRVCKKNKQPDDCSDSSASFTVDNTAPFILITTPSTTPAKNRSLSASSFDGTMGMNVTTGASCDGTMAFSSYTSDQVLTFTSESDNGKRVCFRSVDAAGNTAYSLSNPIVGIDTTAPVFSLSSIASEASSASGATVAFDANVTDNSDPSPSVSCSPASGSLFPIGTTLVECSATDAAGNSASGSFEVTVSDTTPPSLVLPSDVTAEATSPDGVEVSYEASATDTVDSGPVVSCLPASGSTFSLGATLVGCTAADASGNEASGSFTVTVQDTTSPDIPALPDIGPFEATSPSGAEVSYDVPSANDIVDGEILLDCSPSSGSTFSLGETLVDCAAEDEEGNSASGSFSVTVQDTIAPEVNAGPDKVANSEFTQDATASDSGSGIMAFLWEQVSGPGTVTFGTPGSEDTTFSADASGTYAIRLTATDGSGNSAFDEAEIFWDIDAPVVTIGSFPPVNAINQGAVELSGACSEPGEVNVSVESITQQAACTDGSWSSTFDLSPLADGSLSATATQADTAGNSFSANASSEKDVVAPSITGAANGTLGTNGWYTSDVIVSFECADSGSGIADCTDDQTLSSEGANQSLTGAAADNTGNENSATVSGINIDKTAPNITLNSADEMSVPLGFAFSDPGASASDNIDSDVPVDVAGSVNTSLLGDYALVYTASDDAGNAAAPATRTVHVVSIVGDASSISFNGTGVLGAAINGTNATSGSSFSGVQTVEVAIDGNIVLSFDYNFDAAGLDFSTISITTGTTAGGASYVTVSGVNASGGLVSTKTVNLHNASSSFSSVCIEDVDGISISDISSGCNGANEFAVTCNNVTTADGYACSLSGSILTVAGLKNSGVVQFSPPPAPAPAPAPSTSAGPSGSNNGGGSFIIPRALPTPPSPATVEATPVPENVQPSAPETPAQPAAQPTPAPVIPTPAAAPVIPPVAASAAPESPPAAASLFGIDIGSFPWLAIASVIGVVAIAALLFLSPRKKGLEGA